MSDHQKLIVDFFILSLYNLGTNNDIIIETLFKSRLEEEMKIDNIMKQAQKMQKQMMEIQEELANRTVEATVGGGVVTVTANGQQQILSIRIDPEVVDPNDVDMLQDLILAAVNEALRKAQELMTAEMNKLTGGLKIPGLI